MVCLETSFIIDFLRGKSEAVNYLSKIQNSYGTISVASPTVFELVEAAEIARSEEEKQKIKELLSSMTVLALDSEASWKAGELSADLIMSGKQIGHMDLFIGAIALSNGESLATRNIKHFSRISALNVEDYTKD